MKEVIYLLNEMSPFLLLGFLLAGLMHAFIPASYYKRFLSRRSMKSVINAALLGIPLPLCSCGVIPTAMSLRKEGASKGATTAFLIATPQTGVDSIFATYSLMGLPFAIMRPLAALVTSLLGGALGNIADKKEEESTTHSLPQSTEGVPEGYSTRVSVGLQAYGQAPPANECRKVLNITTKLLEALRYAFLEMMEDIGKWLLVGLVLAGLITVLLPDDLFTVFHHNTWASMLLVLVIAIPMYVCATGSIPIAVALMLKGLTPGAALVLLMAGPACNFASILVVRKVMGTSALLTYLLSIVVGAIAFGCLTDWLQFHGAVDFLARLSQVHACCTTESTSIFSWCCTALLCLLLFNALVLNRHHHHHDHEITTTMETTATAVYRIEGMNCSHCRATAEKALRSVPGVETASVSLDTKLAHVTGNASKEALAKAIDEVGFSLKDA